MSTVIEFDDARSRVLQLVAPLGSARRPVAECDQLVLDEVVTAPEDTPGFDSSAMDGYAVRSIDLAMVPASLRVVTTSSAGHPSEVSLGPGEAARILTGAALVDGADCVVRVEDTDGGLEVVSIDRTVAPGADIRRRGEVARAGDAVLERGTLLNPAHLGIAAGVGRVALSVVERPRVAVVSTGDELVLAGGGEPAPGHIHESNSLMIAAMAERLGCIASAHHCGDDPEALRSLLESLAPDAEVILSTGGVSMGGEFDVVRAAVEGAAVEVMKVAIAPGKPLAIGRFDRAAFIGLPGNPVAAAVSFEIFVRPVIRKLRGIEPAVVPTQRGIAGAALSRRDDGRTHLVRVHLDADGRVLPTVAGGTHVLAGLADASALAVLGPATLEVAAGDAVELLPLWS